MDEVDKQKLELDELTLALLHCRAEAARLQEREQLFSTLLGGVNAVLWAFDWDTQRVIYVSPAYERVFGRPVELLLAGYEEWRNAIYPDDLDYAAESFAQVLQAGAVEAREYRIIRADGEVRWLSDKCFVSRESPHGQVHIIVGIAEDITEKKQLEGELHRLATTDVLTQSSNRRHFFECAQREFEQAREYGSPLAFLLLDLDDFKQINDRYGHQMGDQVLQRLAYAGASSLRRGDLFGRIGGEEFAALFPRCEADMALQIAERLQRDVRRLSFNHDDQSFGLSLSQGLTCLRPTDMRLDDLYARADAAMYRAKAEGKNRIVVD